MELVEPAQAKNDKVSVSRKALESVLQQCQSALQLLATDNDDYKNDKVDVGQDSATKYAATDCDTDTVKVIVSSHVFLNCFCFLSHVE